MPQLKDASVGHTYRRCSLKMPDGRQFIRFVNGGSGLAVHVTFFGVEDGVQYGGLVGHGLLAPGATEDVDVDWEAAEDTGPKTITFVTFCRDIDGDTHIWSYDERHRRLSSRKAKRVGEKYGVFFRLMYPGIELRRTLEPGRGAIR
jgi:hypothetical protein